MRSKRRPNFFVIANTCNAVVAESSQHWFQVSRNATKQIVYIENRINRFKDLLADSNAQKWLKCSAWSENWAATWENGP